MTANDKQVGGSHYKGPSFNPWDWDAYGVGYYEINIIKYVVRCYKKNGKEDLEKAVHYLEKLIECHQNQFRDNRSYNDHHFSKSKQLDHFIIDYCLSDDQAVVVYHMVKWINNDDLDIALSTVRKMIYAYTTSDVCSDIELASKET